MNTPKLIISILALVFSFTNLNAQTATPAPAYKAGLQLSLRAGYDFLPMYENNTPYIDYKGGLELGSTLEYYWRWFGLGADVDYITNRPKSIYPTNNLVYLGTPVTTFNLQEAKITRLFYGIGPSFRYQPTSRFAATLGLRGGLANIKGGRTELEGVSSLGNTVLNFHAGYNQKNVVSAKAQLQFDYFFNHFLGLHLGAYYLRHFGVKERVDPIHGFSASYYPFSGREESISITQERPEIREEPCDCAISSVGAFAGITFKFSPIKRGTTQKCNACDVFSLAVTARDKYTKEILPNTDVALTNPKGEIVQTGRTNNFGVVTFNNIVPDDYVINGLLYDVKLDPATAMKSEFVSRETLQKEILYSDQNFILKGKTVMCNTTTPLSGVTVVLKNLQAAEQKNTLTGANGEFLFHLNQQATFQIHGKKENFFSQTETITTSDFNRNTTLFIKLEICMEEVDCDKAIKLNNIHYDLDKYFLREESKKELDRLVQFMVDNPGVRVEVRSHTDSRASNSYNETLSQNRANAAVDYLVSQGISRSRLVGKGYGETQLLNGCTDGVNCSEAQHQLNRRTEMKVICPGRN